MRLALSFLTLAVLAAPAAAGAKPLLVGGCAPEVERLQSSLEELGSSAGGADGCFGARTRFRAAGLHAEVDLGRQLLLLVRNGRVESTFSVSTGRVGFETPTGRFRIVRQERRSWSVPYRVWLPFASYLVGGYAFHARAVIAAAVLEPDRRSAGAERAAERHESRLLACRAAGHPGRTPK